MRIGVEDSQRMFSLAGVRRDVLLEVLREMGPVYLKGTLKREWSLENPTRNFCYVVSEWLVNFILPSAKAFRVVIPGDSAKHYFVRLLPTGTIIDLTAEQFEDYSKVEYPAATRATFMYPSPSKRARVLAERYAQLV